MNPKRNLLRAFCALLCALLLAACNNGTDASSRSIIMAAPPGTGQGAAGQDATPTQPVQDVPLTLTVAARSLSRGYSGNQYGCYSLLSYPDATANIVYVDYDAREMRFLSGPDRADAAQIGRLSGIHAGAVPLVVEENLFVFSQRGTAAQLDEFGTGALAAITKMATDGTGAKTLSLEENLAFHLPSAVLWDGENLYFMATESAPTHAADTATPGVFVLMRLAVQAMELSEVHRFEDGWEYTIEGTWEMGPVISAATPLPAVTDAGYNTAWDTRVFHLYALGMNSGTRTRLYTWQQGLSWTMQDNLFYYWLGENRCLYAMDANNGDVWELARDFGPENYELAVVQSGVLGGFLRMQFSANLGRRTTNYIIEAETGQVRTPANGNLGTNVTVCAQTDGYFLVISGSRWVNRQDADPTYDAAADTSGDYNARFVSVSEFSLIAQEDYWGGNAQYIPIEDLLYG
ncbi:hypothetical protein LJC04_03410 [Ruminococcaceae bacterium OttesenSCG-928-O06]|nr:hypothetical protein [Ruminococcaceae bacterium OttesenSCG-928-O06]